MSEQSPILLPRTPNQPIVHRVALKYHPTPYIDQSSGDSLLISYKR